VKDTYIKHESTMTSKLVVTKAETTGGFAIVSDVEDSDFRIRIRLGDQFEREQVLFVGDMAARALRAALNRFAAESKWDTEP
jgi:hypothetical protein